MSEENAFPRFTFNKEGVDGCLVMDGGMTLRDYFAAKVLHIYAANYTAEGAAQAAYFAADAMLAERSKETE